MRRALIATLVLGTFGLATTSAYATGSCGCVTPKLEKWYATEKVASPGGQNRLNEQSLSCNNVAFCLDVSAHLIKKAKEVKNMTLDQYKIWRKCGAAEKWCKAATACFIAGASEWTVDIAEGDSVTTANRKATHACLVAATAVILSGASPTRAVT